MDPDLRKHTVQAAAFLLRRCLTADSVRPDRPVGAGKMRAMRSCWFLFPFCAPFKAMVFTKEHVAAKAISDHIAALHPADLAPYGCLLGRREEAKGKIKSSPIDTTCILPHG